MAEQDRLHKIFEKTKGASLRHLSPAQPLKHGHMADDALPPRLARVDGRCSAKGEARLALQATRRCLATFLGSRCRHCRRTAMRSS